MLSNQLQKSFQSVLQQHWQCNCNQLIPQLVSECQPFPVKRFRNPDISGFSPRWLQIMIASIVWEPVAIYDGPGCAKQSLISGTWDISCSQPSIIQFRCIQKKNKQGFSRQARSTQDLLVAFHQARLQSRVKVPVIEYGTLVNFQQLNSCVKYLQDPIDVNSITQALRLQIVDDATMAFLFRNNFRWNVSERVIFTIR